MDLRGGTGSLKEDADELKRVAQGEGSLTDKAKAAADALKEPGADGTAPVEARAEEAESPAADGAGGRGRGRGHGKRRGGGGRGGGRGRDRL
jgi:hypothetical protein